MATTIDFNPRSPYGERPIPSSPPSVRSYFNPRSPQGERRSVNVRDVQLFLFQSTLPAGGATIINCGSFWTANFNPRSPQGERLAATMTFWAS